MIFFLDHPHGPSVIMNPSKQGRRWDSRRNFKYKGIQVITGGFQDGGVTGQGMHVASRSWEMERFSSRTSEGTNPVNPLILFQ